MCLSECQTQSVFKNGCLPAGAVLINQNHAYGDLFMPIDSTELRLLEAIDGNRNIGVIATKSLPSSQKKPQRDIARAFFEHPWWYDQVVFDVSRKSGSGL
jgi:hypothetical protein